MIFVYLVITGIFSGVLGGMGMGGGTLLIPLLTILFNFNQKVAQGLNLVSFSIMAIFVLIFHIKNKLVDVKSAIYFASFALASSIGGALLANLIKTSYLKFLFGGLLIIISIYEVIQELIRYYKKK